MQITPSCTAALELPKRGNLLYIHFNDEAFLQELNRNYKETTPMLLSLIRMIQAFRDYQRNVSELSQLSDRELADIGLDRSDIPRVAAGTYNS
jgi:uncharacterized protein YjiS (DUF1127 family)